MGMSAFALAGPRGFTTSGFTTSVLLSGVAIGTSAHSFGFKVRRERAVGGVGWMSGSP